MAKISPTKALYLETIAKHGYDCRHRRNITTAVWAQREGLVEFRKREIRDGNGNFVTGGSLYLTDKGAAVLAAQG